MGIKKTAKDTIRKLVNLTGYDLQPIHSRGLGYISAADTLKTAKEKNLSLLQYLESIWGLETAAKEIISVIELNKHLKSGPFSILEIGAGTGVYSNQIFKILGENNISKYQIYETNKGWSDYLKATYAVEIAASDGYQLGSTNDLSINFIHAHGVFVYTSFITTMSYLKEICRTTKINGMVAFDAFDETCFTPEVIDNMLKSKQTYFNIVPEKFITDLFQDNGFELIKTFYTDWGTGKPKYFVFKRNSL